MSDYEESASDNNSDSDEDDFETITPTVKKISPASIANIDNYNEEDDEIEDDEDDDIVDGDDYEDDVPPIKGGAKKEEVDESDVDDSDAEDILNAPIKNQLETKQEPSSNYNTDDDTDVEEEDENYLQKFDSEITKNYVNDFHPECFQHNYDEILNLTKIVRDDSNIIIDPFHKTIPYLTKYERARVLGQRAKQIEYGATPFVKVAENVIEPHIIAELELEQKKIPFIIRRPLPNNSFEYWNLKDLEIIIY
jgi:DNA-directed RNA polymerase subunit K/omega